MQESTERPQETTPRPTAASGPGATEPTTTGPETTDRETVDRDVTDADVEAPDIELPRATGGRLAEVAARLDRLEDVPLAERPALFERLDELLTEELSVLDEV